MRPGDASEGQDERGRGRTGKLSRSRPAGGLLRALSGLGGMVRHSPAGRMHACLIRSRHSAPIIPEVNSSCPGTTADCGALLPMHLPSRPPEPFLPARGPLGRRRASRRAVRRTAWLFAEWFVTYHNPYEVGIPKPPGAVCADLRTSSGGASATGFLSVACRGRGSFLPPESQRWSGSRTRHGTSACYIDRIWKKRPSRAWVLTSSRKIWLRVRRLRYRYGQVSSLFGCLRSAVCASLR